MRKLDRREIQDIATEINITPAFLEKDWYLVSALNILQSTNTEDLSVVFAGGTSLSKGYGLISRFSEDIDFVVSGAENLNRNKRSKYKKFLIEKLTENNVLSVDFEKVFAKDENRFFNFFLDYPKNYTLPDALRDGIKMEITVKPTYLEPIYCEVTTFIGEYVENAPTAYIPCVSPVETAANKFCGLMWRLEQEHKKYLETGNHGNRSLMRHLHDLSALYSIVIESEDFVPLITQIYKIDKTRGYKERDIELFDFIEQTYNIIKNNDVYKQNYENFVNRMYYGKTNMITFEDAVSNYESLCNFVIDNGMDNSSNPSMR